LGLATIMQTTTFVMSRHPEVLIERSTTSAAAAADADATTTTTTTSRPTIERATDSNNTTEDDDGIRILRLDAPDTLNCLSDEMARGFSSALEELRATRNLRAVVVTGQGRGFCAGGSFRFIQQRLESDDPAGNGRALHELYKTFLAVRSLPVPVIAAVNGPAVGGGAGLALACDVCLIAEGAGKIGFNFVKLGITPGMASTFLLPLTTSHAAACRLLLTGDVVGADEAVRLGLALASHPPDMLLPAALALARRMAEGCPRAVRETLRMLRSRGGGEEAMLRAAEQEAGRQGWYFTQADAKEGLEAVKGKRGARFAPPEEEEE
jgi:enoyl-CoA hydratase